MGAEASPISSPCIEDVHVLVVDDCPVDRKIVEKLLLKNGTFKGFVNCNCLFFSFFFFFLNLLGSN